MIRQQARLHVSDEPEYSVSIFLMDEKSVISEHRRSGLHSVLIHREQSGLDSARFAPSEKRGCGEAVSSDRYLYELYLVDVLLTAAEDPHGSMMPPSASGRAEAPLAGR